MPIQGEDVSAARTRLERSRIDGVLAKRVFRQKGGSSSASGRWEV